MFALVRSVVSMLAEPRDSVRDFFHAPADVRMFAALRIGYATFLLINVLCWLPDLDKWYSEEGVLPLAASRQTIDAKCLTLFQILPTSRLVLHVCYGVFLFHIVALLVGWWPRVQAACCYVWLVSFHHRNNLLIEGEDTVFRVIGFLLIFMPLGTAWSIDSVRRSKTPSMTTPLMVDGWPLRLLQIEMAMLYFSAAWSKLLGSAWRDGTALYYVARLDEYWDHHLVPTWIVDSPWTIRGMTWMTLALEFSVPVLIWFPPTRRVALLMVILFHLGCDYAMHLFLFHWIMLVGWLSFATPDDAALLRNLFRSAFHRLRQITGRSRRSTTD